MTRFRFPTLGGFRSQAVATCHRAIDSPDTLRGARTPDAYRESTLRAKPLFGENNRKNRHDYWSFGFWPKLAAVAPALELAQFGQWLPYKGQWIPSRSPQEPDENAT